MRGLELVVRGAGAVRAYATVRADDLGARRPVVIGVGALAEEISERRHDPDRHGEDATKAWSLRHPRQWSDLSQSVNPLTQGTSQPE